MYLYNYSYLSSTQVDAASPNAWTTVQSNESCLVRREKRAEREREREKQRERNRERETERERNRERETKREKQREQQRKQRMVRLRTSCTP